MDDPSDGVLTIVKNTPDKEIRGGFCFINGKYISLRDFLKGTGTIFEEDVDLRSNSRITIFLGGTPDASINVEVKKKGVTPPPEVTFTADPTTIYVGQSSTLSWTSSNADTCVIEPSIGSVDLNGSIAVSPTETTTYTITATSGGGTAMDSLIITVSPPISLAITSPSDGENLNRPDVIVQGTVTNALSFETGLTVNGVVAIVSGDQFVANHVPLQEGENTITATATDTQGYTTSDSVTVNVENIEDYIKITAMSESGISPLETRLSTDGSFSFTESSLAYTGPGTVEFLESNQDKYLVRITVEGIYNFTAQVTDAGSNVHTDTVAVVVLDQTQLDQLLKAKWNGMKAELANQEIEKVSNYFTGEAQDLYKDIFEDLYDQLPQIAQDMQDIELIYVENNVAKYRIRKNELYGGQNYNLTYYIYFVVDGNGLWKIHRY